VRSQTNHQSPIENLQSKISNLKSQITKLMLSTEMAPTVRIESLTKIYEESKTQRAVLNNLDITFEAGKFSVLLGRSGSGKSTLLNLISGIDLPTEGQIWIADVNVTRLSERERTLLRRKHIGFIFQFFNLIPTLTAGENISLPIELAGGSERLARQRAQELLERVGLGDHFDDYPDRLSGGEQQRVAIARALAHDPVLIVADDPTGNLDEETAEAVLELLLNLVRAVGKTLIMATHSLEIVPYADHVFRMKDGQLVEETSRARRGRR
jgi:putative ABC transport system ATP-binding protein